jgi:hypothetical protein
MPTSNRRNVIVLAVFATFSIVQIFTGYGVGADRTSGPVQSNKVPSTPEQESHGTTALDRLNEDPAMRDTPDDQSELLPAFASQKRTDDLPEMRQRKLIRALVTFSKTDFFLTKGRPRGSQADFLR